MSRGLKEDRPFIFFSDIIFLAEIYQVGNGFCGKKLKGIDDVYLVVCQKPELGKKSAME